MTITAEPPIGGTIAELGGKSRPLLLRNEEIERFEKHHNCGIFAIFDALFLDGDAPKVHQIRDLVALGLVGGGQPDRAADQIVASMPPSANFTLRQIAGDMILAAFTPENPEKKSDTDGSSGTPGATATDGTPPVVSDPSSPPA
ncbi:GTA-gp10 family protein [Salipiger abyssi]|uniref:GTA-gp10 family protein n=1 Tax=Salipiger abyssi TaxID=1250539 RepID=UPI001A8F8831|nr:GTA-gp10 family protein [Salipiger abyssi]MBN9890121.1 gene transfer agent family protein [Salipiger abyssi]